MLNIDALAFFDISEWVILEFLFSVFSCKTQRSMSYAEDRQVTNMLRGGGYLFPPLPPGFQEKTIFKRQTMTTPMNSLGHPGCWTVQTTEGGRQQKLHFCPPHPSFPLFQACSSFRNYSDLCQLPGAGPSRPTSGACSWGSKGANVPLSQGDLQRPKHPL